MRFNRRSWWNGWTLVLVPGAMVLAWAAATPLPSDTSADEAPPPGVAELAGFIQAEQRLGDAAPTGAGIVLGHVEGDADHYLPRVDHHRYRAMDLHPRSGDSQPLHHTDATARIIFGPQGLAHGIREVHHFATHHWLTEGYLHAGEIRGPAVDRPHLFNHSWVARDSELTEAQIAHALRRVDYVIDRRGVVMCVGVDNSRTSRVPGMLGSAYNVIAVGLASGASSGGGTRIEGDGRLKPDIAGPGSRTSYATPVVTAAAARLLEAAGSLASDAELARRPETIKALLMAGATKPWNWRQRDGRSMDRHLGAGVVHLDNALRILEAGRVDPDQPRPGAGWDLRLMQPGDHAVYRVAADVPLDELSIVLTWHRRIDGRTRIDPVRGQAGWLDTPRLARFDLRLVHVNEQGQAQLVADSLSDVDNVQHIYVTDAPAGEYLLLLSRRDDGHAEPWPAAIAWRAGERVPYPADPHRE